MGNFQQQVITAASQGALVLTANKRLFRSLRAAFDQQMQKSGAAAWPTARIQPYDGWLKQCLDTLGEGWRLLSPQQQRQLWEEQITGATRGSVLELMNLDKTTDSALRAHNLLTEYDVSVENHQLTEDQQIFLGWRRGYQQRCNEHQWLDQGTLARRIIQAFADGDLPVPRQVLLVGFDQLPAGALALAEQLRVLGAVCEEPAPGGTAGSVLRFAAADERHETETMACWVRYHLERGASSIGIVVPELQRRRQQIERLLRHQIDPPASAGFTDSEAVFSLSLGSPLAAQGVIAGALAGLDGGQRLTLDQASFLLRSPFFAGSAGEADQRALFDQRLRSFCQESFSLSGLLHLARRFGRLPVLERILTSLLERSRQPRSPEGWAATFAAELQQLGWPGEVSLSSTSYQAVKAWYDKVLTGLASLDPVLPRIDRNRAVRIVRQMAQELEFQPESGGGPVQVVGLLESSGLSFDHLWVMGLGETVVPALPRPNPFIPYPVQESLQMPHASFSRELDFAEQVLLRLRHAAPDIVFSYPKRGGDCELKPSRLICGIGAAGEPQLFPRQDLLTKMQADAALLEPWSDAQGPALTDRETTGGTALLKDQAHCPFRAFVHHRLRVRAFEQARPGLSPVIRGDLVHLTLRAVWAQLHDQAGLLHLDQEQRRELVATHVETILASYFERRSEPLQPLLLLEKQRIVSLITEWFDEVEIPRDDFTVVATEQEQQVAVGPLRLRLVIDRVDRLAGGGQIIIDYKTGADLRTSDFLTDPLLEPQLPSYAVAGGEGAGRVEGVAIAKVRRGDCRLLGIVSADGVLGPVKGVASIAQARSAGITDWRQLLAFWRERLETLAEDFAAGVAAVHPYDRQVSCRFCDLPGLCRIGETDLENGTDDGI